MKFYLKIVATILFLIKSDFYQAQKFTKHDTLFGSNTIYRKWWDVLHYDLSVTPDYNSKTITGCNTIQFKIINDSFSHTMQIDLQQPMRIDSLFFNSTKINVLKHDSDFWYITLPQQIQSTNHFLKIYFSGKPHEAKNPPWSGGWVWKKDSLNNPWMSVACQGTGASIWFPCKDIQGDEPDLGTRFTMIVPDTLVGIGNGKLINKQQLNTKQIAFTWEIKNAINSYNIIPYIGKYSCVSDSVKGEKGILKTDYWVLNYHIKKIPSHLKPNVTKTLACFEHWFGPYPFYEDSYKIVEAPYLGMEHQSNVAYGNYYMNGYAGRDLSKTGWGLKWDFIVVHESGHEWFGNNITATDVADNWIHEGFTSYSEVLFTECEFGKEAGSDYCEGVKKAIDNDIPIIGNYNVHNEGSGDMYNKGSQVVHMIRQIINDDIEFRNLLRELNKVYYHKTVSSLELEQFICKYTQIDFTQLFNQYLRTTQVPTLEYKISNNKLMYRYTNCLKPFSMPIKITTTHQQWITPTNVWQTLVLTKKAKSIKLDRNFYVTLKKVN